MDDATFNCTVNKYPTSATRTTGGLVGNTAIVCGGYGPGHVYHKSCYSLKEDGTWKVGPNLKERRSWATAASIISNNELVIAGGTGKFGNLKTIEVVAPNTRSRLPITLPVGVHAPCIVAWDTNTFLIIGGNKGGVIYWTVNNRKQTYFIDVTNNTITEGPELLTARSMFGCHTIKVNGEDFIVVAGGLGAGLSTEYLQKANFASGWKKSKNQTVV